MSKKFFALVLISLIPVIAKAEAPVFFYGNFDVPATLRSQIESQIIEHCVPASQWTAVLYDSSQLVFENESDVGVTSTAKIFVRLNAVSQAGPTSIQLYG